MKENILVVAPHCDDEVLGCGGIIAKHNELGSNVYVVVVTNGHIGAPELFSEQGTKKVRAHAQKAHDLLGVEQTIYLDYPAPKLDTIPAYKLANDLKDIIFDKKISTLFIPHRGDIHKDHRICYEASLVAARPINRCPVNVILSYETLSETEWAPPFGDDMFIPNVFKNITDFIDLKKEAMSCFTSQIKEFPHSRSLESIEALSKYRGSTVGFYNAEAFMLVRQIHN